MMKMLYRSVSGIKHILKNMENRLDLMSKNETEPTSTTSIKLTSFEESNQLKDWDRNLEDSEALVGNYYIHHYIVYCLC